MNGSQEDPRCESAQSASQLTLTEKQRIYSQRWRERNPEKHAAKTKKWRENNPDYANAYVKKWREGNKDKVKQYQKNWRDNNLEKEQAHYAVRKALKEGIIQKPTRCEQCGKEDHLHGHHDDYSRHLDVRWLCSKCHVGLSFPN